MSNRTYYPTSIRYVATYLLKAGFDVEIINCIGDHLSHSNDTQIKILKSLNQFSELNQIIF